MQINIGEIIYLKRRIVVVNEARVARVGCAELAKRIIFLVSTCRRGNAHGFCLNQRSLNKIKRMKRLHGLKPYSDGSWILSFPRSGVGMPTGSPYQTETGVILVQ